MRFFVFSQGFLFIDIMIYLRIVCRLEPEFLRKRSYQQVDQGRIYGAHIRSFFVWIVEGSIT